jgi:superfamily II DNA or RNA helicase
MKSFLEAHNNRAIASYRALPSRLKEDYGIEEVVLAGGYGYRQIAELVQNGADAVLEAHEHDAQLAEGNRIHVLLRESRLYVANTGAPLSEEGLESLLMSHSSPKRGNQIGRFGLGFKSLLRLGGRIDLYTKASGAIRFDPVRCQDELRCEFGVTEAPGLRLAWPIDECERDSDEVLGKFDWAETIVRVEVQTSAILQHLREEIRAFPAEFLIFFPLPTELILDDGEKPPRELRTELDGDEQLLHDGSETSRWRIARREVTISDDRARADATHIHARESVPLVWAFPLEGKREEAGRFWAFFPTHTPTYLPGILNAPWKLNSDRKSIIGGEWNSALMVEAARLIVETLPSLSGPADLARPLDAFPRQLERRDEDAAPLVEATWKQLVNTAVVPDAQGVLRLPDELSRHPLDDPEIATRWQSCAHNVSLAQFIHPSCLERQRWSRLNALADRLNVLDTTTSTHPKLARRKAEAWFQAVASVDPQGAIQALHLAKAYASSRSPDEWNMVRPLLAIIPSQAGHLVTAGQVVFAPGVPGRETVAATVCDDAEARRILEDVMKVRVLDDSVWESVLRESLKVPLYPDALQDAGWRSFWAKLRSAPPTVRGQFVKANCERIRILRRDSKWVDAASVLVPGALICAEDPSENRKLLVDAEMHGEDGELLAALGVTDFPEGQLGPAVYATVTALHDGLNTWRDDCRKDYKKNYDNAASWDYLEPIGLTLPRAWWLLEKLSGLPNARLTERLLSLITKGEYCGLLKFGHSTMSSYPKTEVRHPLPAFVLKHGRVQVGEETVRLSAVFARRGQPALRLPTDWEHLSAAFEKLSQIGVAHPPLGKDIQALWLALFKSCVTSSRLADDSLQCLWTDAANDGVLPDPITSDSGSYLLSQVFVTGSADLARRARTPSRIVITLDDKVSKLWESKGARNLSELLRPECTSIAGPAALLLSALPELENVLTSDARELAHCQQISGLKLWIDTTSEPLPCLMWEGTLLLDDAQLYEVSRAQRMILLVREVTAAGWLNCSPEEAVQRLGNAQVDQRRAQVAKGDTLAARLLLAMGGRRDPLLDALGELKTTEFIRQCSAQELAELTLAQLGPATLVTVRDALEAEGLQPPSRWNTPDARDFVASIGFPNQFAASPEGRREAEEFISGPIPLGQLHDFQEDVLEGLRELLASSATRRRAVVSLPTGGGKTRVTVEGAVRLVLAPDGNRRSVLWVAQTDELCEQAVQAFRQVWINHGAERTDLRIVRMWGGNPSPVMQESAKPVVVIASIQTLNSRMGGDRLGWLRQPGLVVVDECHHAITPSYSNLLRWLDAEAPRSGTAEKDQPPILGLSATPFRTDDEESRRLAKRFDQRWLPSDQEELHARLCSQGVLAMADYEPLESGIGLVADEVERLARLQEPWEGLEFEKLLEDINQRLALDTQRTKRLLERIQTGAERAILFFANSVRHAEEMSARLNLAGIPAAAVSGDTPTVARRYFLDQFQCGDIRVLCNHSVLSTGFDAPKTDMVLIARQVFSPVRYMQMVGRGLRGEKNGGTARCRIVTVVDNLGRFQERHPYHYCQRYFANWSKIS